MSYANGTTHYNLPQTVGTDKRDWFDTNTAFENVDADLYSAKQTADNAASDITSLGTRVGTVEGDVSSLSTRVGNAEGDISALQGGQTTLGNQIADVKADLSDAICAIKEADATADYAHAVDSYFWYNDTLYITTQAIAVGDTIVPNTNCNTTNVTTEIIKALTQSTSEIDDSVTSASKTWSSQKINDEIGDLSTLTTTDKSSAVNAINEVKSDLDKLHASVSYRATSGQTYAQAFASLSALIDRTKITSKSTFVFGKNVMQLARIDGNAIEFSHSYIGTNFVSVYAKIDSTSVYKSYNGSTVSDASSADAGEGEFTIYY